MGYYFLRIYYSGDSNEAIGVVVCRQHILQSLA
nr:MAG TPA: hypothetical protein [Caudoviricetes sp.]